MVPRAVTKAGWPLTRQRPCQVAAIFRRQGGDERRPPARHETIAAVEGAETREARVDEPQVVAGPGHFVNLHVTGDVAESTGK